MQSIEIMFLEKIDVGNIRICVGIAMRFVAYLIWQLLLYLKVEFMNSYPG
jgi:hypothetical protein